MTPAEDRDEWRTPPFVFAWACERYGKHDIDLAATEGNALCLLWRDKAENALDLRWRAAFGDPLNAWCNPPYSKRAPWLEKAAAEWARGQRSTWLIPAPNGEDYWRHVFGIAEEIVFIQGRLSYLTPAGKPMQGNRFGSVLVRYDRAVKHTRCAHVERNEMRRWYAETQVPATG